MSSRMLAAGFLWSCVLGFAQSAPVPQIAAGGIVNAASWSSFVAPGSIVAIFGTNLAASPVSASAPFPVTLGGTAVTVNGIPAPLLFVSPGQINAQLPAALAAQSGTVGSATAVVTTPAGSTNANLYLTPGAPGFFSANGTGCGQASALNIRPDGTVSINSPTNSAAPGDSISLFGTGFGLAAIQPPDGTAVSGTAALATTPGFFLNQTTRPTPTYTGLAPGLPGVDQLNFQVPATTRNGCAIPVSASQTFGSASVTVAVQTGRGQCVDPPIQSYGQISLSKFTYSGTGTSSAQESFGASFTSGPAVVPPAAEEVVFAPNFVANASVGSIGGAAISFALLTNAPLVFPACPVAGYSQLSAGAIQIQPSPGTPVNVQPEPLLTGGVTYGAGLSTGFIVPGTYTITGTPGNAVTLNTSVTVGSPISITTPFPAGTSISSSQPLTVSWTGGDANSLVRVALISGQGLTEVQSYSYAHATDHSLTLNPFCSGHSVSSGGNGVVCSFGLPASSTAQIAVSVLPAQPQIVTMPGVTGPVQVNWSYGYNFSGLTLTN